jgi:hypothetical protein
MKKRNVLPRRWVTAVAGLLLLASRPDPTIGQEPARLARARPTVDSNAVGQVTVWVIKNLSGWLARAAVDSAGQAWDIAFPNDGPTMSGLRGPILRESSGGAPLSRRRCGRSPSTAATAANSQRQRRGDAESPCLN